MKRPNVNILGSLHILDSNELLLEWNDPSGKTISKFVSVHDAKAAFNLQVGEDSNWIRPNIIRVGTNNRGNWVFYWQPPQQKVVTILDKDIQLPIPGTLMLGWGRNFYIWTTKQREFISTMTLCVAPFPNVYSNGRICWGSFTPKAITSRSNNIENAWNLFFNTAFNNHMTEKKCISYPEDLLVLLRKLDRKRVFPVDELIPYRAITPDTVMQQLQEGGLRD